MNVFVCGEDRTADLGAACVAAAADIARHPAAPESFAEGHSVMHLCTAEDEPAYLRVLLSLLVARCGANVDTIEVPRKQGWVGAVGGALRQALWKLLRYQHARIVSQQNAIHANMTAAMEMMHQELKAELATCRARIEELEARCTHASDAQPEDEKGPDHAG